MSEETTASPNDDYGGLCCQNCSPTTRKFGYYITFGFGLIVFGFGLIHMIFNSGTEYLVAGSVIILFCPLWIKNCSGCFADLKNAIKLTSTLIYIIFLVLNIVGLFIDWGGVIRYILGGCLGVSGVWYFLSFFPNGQQACIACMKNCCCSEKSTTTSS